MTAFFGQDDEDKKANGAQAPVLAGSTTREQFAAPALDAPAESGAAGGGGGGGAPAAQGTPAPAPGTAAPKASGGGAKAPAFTNLMTFMGSQGQGQRDAGFQAATKDAVKAGQQAGAGVQQAVGGVRAEAERGTNTGSVAQTAGRGTVFGAGPQYDLSKVNFSGYQGPGQDQVAQRFQGVQAGAENAAQQAQALKTGGTSHNAFDRALLTQTPTWEKVLGVVKDTNQAAGNAQAASGGAQEISAAAARASDANVAAQKAQLGDAQTEIDHAATNQREVMGSVAQRLESGKTSDLLALATDTATMKALGIPPENLRALVAGIQNGQLPPKQVQDALAPYIKAAKNWSGYNAGTAGQRNQIGTLLNSSTPAVAESQGGAGNTDLRGVASTNEKAAQELYDAAGALKQEMTNSSYNRDTVAALNKRAKAAVAQLLSAGFTPEQIAAKTGLSPDKIKAFSGATTVYW